MSDDHSNNVFNRREFIKSAFTASAALPLVADAAASSAAPIFGSTQDTTSPVTMRLRINDQPYTLSLDIRTTLLDALRDHVGLTGAKKGCGHGQCGACTVHINGKRVLSCLTLAVMTQHQSINTVEGLGTSGKLHPMQQAFIDHDAFQCGYCTPGQIMSAIACVKEGHANTSAQIREYMSGNLCRCAAYPNIVAAIEQARDQMRSS